MAIPEIQVPRRISGLRAAPRPLPRHAIMLVAIVGGIGVAGCGGADGPARYRVSGRVTCGGEPVPYGEVLFTPDGGKGNTGPQGIATIKQGRYDTAGSRAAGIAGGPTIVRVTALRSPTGGLIAEHELELEFPEADSERDIEIPRPTGPLEPPPEI